MSEKKLFFYNLPADEVEVFDINKCFMISEEELPKPSKEYNLCAIFCKRIPKNVPLGSDVCIAVGDPIILEGEGIKILSRKINHTDPNIPNEVKKLQKKNTSDYRKIYTFERNGKRVWVLHDFVCLLDDLKNEVNEKLREQKEI